MQARYQTICRRQIIVGAKRILKFGESVYEIPRRATMFEQTFEKFGGITRLFKRDARGMSFFRRPGRKMAAFPQYAFAKPGKRRFGEITH